MGAYFYRRLNRRFGLPPVLPPVRFTAGFTAGSVYRRFYRQFHRHGFLAGSLAFWLPRHHTLLLSCINISAARGWVGPWVNLPLFAQSGVSEVLGEFTAFFHPCHSHLDNNSRTINPPVETELLPRPHHSSLLL